MIQHTRPHHAHRPRHTSLRFGWFIALATTTLTAVAAPPSGMNNPLIDDKAFVADVMAAQKLRAGRRVTEAEFIRMAKAPGTVVLDARSERLYALRHIAGAVNLSFPEFTKETLARVIPTPGTRVLIYCNNNFLGAPESMPTKALPAALNLSTFVSLYSYGYRNVYELGPAIDVSRSTLAFAGREVAQRR